MKVHENPLRDILRLFMWYPLRWVICFLPVIQGIKMLQCLGDIHYHCSRKRRQQLARTIKRFASKSLDVNLAVQTYFQNHYIDQLFILIFPRMKMSDVSRVVDIEGVEFLEQYLREKRGIVLVHGHFGPAHLPLVVLSLLGFTMKQIGNPSDAGLSWIGRNVAYRLRMHYEALIPAEIIPVNKFLRPVFTALRNNAIVMTTGDGSGTEKEFGPQHPYRFLGQPLSVPLGPAILASKTGAALLPVFIVPGEQKLFRIVIGKKLQAEPGAINSEISIMQDFMAQYEQYAMFCPGYVHFLDRWEKVE